MVDKPVLLEQSTVYPMTSLQHDIDDLDVNIELDSQRDINGISTGLTSNETNPKFTRKQLTAQPLQAKTIITDNFMEENIEKENFLSTYLGLLADKMGPAFELFGVYADTSVSTVTGEGTGYKMTNGILAQAKTIKTDNNNPCNGLSNLITLNSNPLEGVLDAIDLYIEQDGDLSNANIVLSPVAYSKLMRDIYANRDTPLGDAVLLEGECPTIMGLPLVADSVLKDTRNGYDTMKFTDGEYKGNGTNVSRMNYGFIGNPNNIVFGMMRDFNVINQWDIDVLGYKIAMLCKGDVKIHFDQDTLILPCTLSA